MFRISLLYPNEPGSHFDVEYYLKVHIPMVLRLAKLKIQSATVEIGQSAGTPELQPHFAAIESYTVESPLDFFHATKVEGKSLRGDMINYTNIIPLIQVGEIRIEL